jgi:phage terminase large subunit-like protein
VNTIESPIRLPANWLTRIPTNSSSNSNSSQPKSTLEQLSKQKAAIEQELSKREGWKIQQALDRLNARRKILKYFSDDGPTRRELYVKHLEFFRAGALYRSRLFRAANRCLTPWSTVETDHGERQVRELIGERGFYVRSWDGSSQCTKSASPVFQVGTEPAFQIHLDNGEAFQCSHRHRVWCGATLDGHRQAGWVSVGQLIRDVGGLHCRRTLRGWMASYVAGDRLCDAPPEWELDSSDARLPTPRDVPSSGPGYLPGDGAASRFEHNHAYLASAPTSIADAERRLVDLCDKTEAPNGGRFAPPSFWKNQAERQSLYESGQLQSVLADWLKTHESALTGVTEFLLALNCDAGRKLGICRRSIVAIVPLGYQPIVDFTVEHTHCYWSSGILHHNTGKTQAAAYETALHLMGIYPPWWEGRRFDRPIEAWAVNISWEKARDVNQSELCGNPERPDEIGTGMVPGERLIRYNYHGYTKHGMDTIAVRHVSGGDSILQFKSYSQGRESFESNAKDLIWLDEECPEDIYTACEMRTMTTNGILLLTYTPVLGLTPLTELFEREADRPGQIMGAA